MILNETQQKWANIYERKGTNGFGYDPLFYIDGRAFAEYTPEEKDKVSHRGNALRLFAEEVKKYL